ncbi:hypothetical protein QR676_07330 [Vibrio sp. TMPB1044]|uniref:hypothetical protein n=1 Tax=Vibrio sp. TMPB1044 TaxID=3051822 RepID=UPI00255B7838|nr:hypothetical protein [Vibrio sp. TMPB1044]MDL5027039.1 hypothetical protein [Vibrio sp. TMPB1044]MDN5207167.1 hypothetical protein [Vibrio sp. TMPB1044]
MKIQNTKYKIIAVIAFTTLLSGCPLEGDDGKTGTIGAAGPTGATGLAGINCWDINGNRVDDQDEDVNFDGAWNALDCRDTSSIAQVKEAELNHQHVCDAFANLSPPVYPDGCPSANATAPSGTLTQFYRGTDSKLFDDGANGYTTCNITPNNGPLSIVYRTNKSSAWFELEDAYIAKRESVETASEIDNDDCYNLCNGDPRCIASLAYKVDSDLQSSECLIFYHSDTVTKFERPCGFDYGGNEARDYCRDGLGLNNRWSAKCP